MLGGLTAPFLIVRLVGTEPDSVLVTHTGC